MGDSNRECARLTIGLDLGDKYSHLCVLDSDGELEEEGRVATTSKALQRRFRSYPESRVAIEVSTHSPWVSRVLQTCGHEVLVANPRRLRMIYQNDSKSDRVDAEMLARVARMDPRLLAPIRHRGVAAQVDLAILRSRDTLVASRTKLVNHVRGTVKAFGERLPKCSTRSFHKNVGAIPMQLRPALSAVMEMIAGLTNEIQKYDQQIEEMAREKYPEAAALRQVNGVGPLTAVTYILTIGNPTRFKTSRSLGSYLGLRPRRDESGDHDPQMRITKAGDLVLRRLLVGCGHYILGPFGEDCDLRRRGLVLCERGGKNARKRAVVAVARKLAVLLHRLWITGEVYEPLRNTTSNMKRRATAA